LVFTSCRAVLPLKIAWIFVAAASKSAPATVLSTCLRVVSSRRAQPAAC
jgi:hypothetical protein